MKEIKVDTASLSNSKKSANGLLQELEGALAEMKASVEALNGTWQGGNHDEFVVRFEDRYEQTQQAKQLLEKYLKSMDKAVKQYEQCGSEVQRLASF